ncbi:hypothetical protein ACVOMT_16525 [Sphingomonas panni]
MGIEASLSTPLAHAVRAIGSQSGYARLTGQSQGNVYRSLSTGGEVRDKDVAVVAAATGIPKDQLRPDLFGPSEMSTPRTERP